MDANKLMKLQEIGYQLPPSCSICVHGNFRGNAEFGGCTLHRYDHLKHDANGKELSVHRTGRCRDFEPEPVAMGRILHFDPLFSDGLETE